MKGKDGTRSVRDDGEELGKEERNDLHDGMIGCEER